MFRLVHLPIETLREHVVVLHRSAVTNGELGFSAMDRVRVVGEHPETGETHEVTAVLAFSRDGRILDPDAVGLTDLTFEDLGLPEGVRVTATLAPAPASLGRVRAKLRGERLDRAGFDAVLADVVRHRYSRVELSMFVLGCGLRQLDVQETIDFTRAMIDAGSRLDFGAGPIADKHCVGGIPGNRTTMIVVPILVALGLVVPKTSSKAITSPAGTADTMGTLARVALGSQEMHRIVEEVGGCMAWGGALDLAPADDILITVERPMEIDTEPQMVASILAKKKTAGATHVLIDIPVGPTAKVRSRTAARRLEALFCAVAAGIGLRIETVVTEASGPIGRGIGPRLEALDVLAVLQRAPDAPADLREKSLFLAARLLEMTGAAVPNAGYRTACDALESGAAAEAFDRIVDAQGRRELPAAAQHRYVVPSRADGRIKSIDCWAVARVAKCAGAPGSPAAGVRLAHSVGDVVRAGEPLLEIHSQSAAQLEFAREYVDSHPRLVELGF